MQNKNKNKQKLQIHVMYLSSRTKQMPVNLIVN